MEEDQVHAREQERRKQSLRLQKGSETEVSRWLQHGGASKRLLGTNKANYLSRSICDRRDIGIVVVRIPSG